MDCSFQLFSIFGTYSEIKLSPLVVEDHHFDKIYLFILFKNIINLY